MSGATVELYITCFSPLNGAFSMLSPVASMDVTLG
jgi:hypothetical protein